MSAIGDAQARTLDDARVIFLGAQSALDQAKETAERLNEAHLLPEDLAWEAIGAIDGMCGMLDDLVEAVD
jgi:hypothetical protein